MLTLCSFRQRTILKHSRSRDNSSTTTSTHSNPSSLLPPKGEEQNYCRWKGITSITTGTNPANSTAIRKRQIRYFHQGEVFESQKLGELGADLPQFLNALKSDGVGGWEIHNWDAATLQGQPSRALFYLLGNSTQGITFPKKVHMMWKQYSNMTVPWNTLGTLERDQMIVNVLQKTTQFYGRNGSLRQLL